MDRKKLIAILLLPTLLALGSTGCEEEAVRVYQVPKPEIIDPTAGRFRQMPHTHEDQPTINPPTAKDFRFTGKPPDNWVKQPDRGTLRLAGYTIRQGDVAAEFTVIALPASVVNPAQVINQWGQQVGLEPMSPEQTTDLARPFDRAQPYDAMEVDVPGPSERIFSILVVRGELVWFYTITGEPNLVGGQIDVVRDLVAGVVYEGRS